jgi:hypothetical protein
MTALFILIDNLQRRQDRIAGQAALQWDLLTAALREHDQLKTRVENLEKKSKQ